MTTEEMEKVASICAEADSGCHVCAGSLFDELKKVWPEHSAVIDKVEEREFPD